MKKTIVFLHTVASLAAMFDKLAKDAFGADAEIMHLVDEMLLKDVLRNGGLTTFEYQRVSDHAVAVERFGADILQLTC